MLQLSSSLRVARASLKHPHPFIRQTRTQNALLHRDATVSRIVHHANAVSTRAIAGMAVNSSSFNNNMMDRYNGRLDTITINRRPTFNYWSAQSTMMMSTSTTEPNRNADASEPSTNETKTMETETDAQIIPFRRSKAGKSKAKIEGSGFDKRAQAKMAVLSIAKKEAEDAKNAYLSSSSSSSNAGGDSEQLHAKWNLSEQTLALAYSQAIKYTSRINKNAKATKTAELLLFGWMDRFMHPFGSSLVWVNDDNGKEIDPNTMYMNKKKMVRTIHEIMPILTSSDSTTTTTTSFGEEESVSTSSLPLVRIPPPSSKDYINLLRAYSMSKARRKGQHCEALMANMMELANTVTHHYNEDNEKQKGELAHDVGMESVASGEGNETKKWRLWVDESIPNSKAFALAIKCHAGSTHNESLERIITLNYIHDSISKCCQSQIPGIFIDDPYVLFHSIKALTNLQKNEERKLGQEWLDRIHEFVTNPENMDYFQEMENASENERATDQSEGLDAPATRSLTIDVTSAYTTMIRLMARLRGAKEVAADARKILDRMHGIHDIFVNGLEESESQTPPTDKAGEPAESEVPGAPSNRKRIAYIDIKSNAYNLVLGLYRDSKKSEDATKSVELLQQMVEAGNAAEDDRIGVPLPNEQSFEFTITSLANMSDGEKAIQEAERLIDLMQEQDYLESSATAYNSYITVCNKQLFGKPQLYDKALEILDKMNELSKTTPGVSTNPETLALIMKACSLSEHDDHVRVLDTATKLFSQLEEQEPDEKSAQSLTDRAFYYMMKCVDTHMIGDQDAKKERIEELFSEACQRGLCSANVLTMFRNSVSKEDFKLTVGKGRLADHWIANIKGPRALYTDGSKGGADKHARRKGKSTSDWAKKKKVKEFQKDARRGDKNAKKFFKKKKIVS